MGRRKKGRLFKRQQSPNVALLAAAVFAQFSWHAHSLEQISPSFIFAQAEGSAMAHFEGLWSGSYWAVIDWSVLAWRCGELQGVGSRAQA